MEGTHTVGARFTTTNWSLLEALRDDDHPKREQALALLSRRYWPAIYATFRRMGKSREEAADLTQGFYADVILGRRLFERADAERGRLRSLLITAVKRYAVTAHRSQSRRRDGAGVSLENLGREEAFLGGEVGVGPEEAFDRRWALSLLDEALSRCEASLRSEGLTRHWEAFEARALRPALGAVERPSLALLAERMEFASEAHVASALKVVRKRLDLMLREVAAETATDATGQEEEYHTLRALLEGGT
jgi:DNA-directed RNA polymerase specialized sigma24 family protein